MEKLGMKVEVEVGEAVAVEAVERQSHLKLRLCLFLREFVQRSLWT
jgi:hypothetical protein